MRVGDKFKVRDDADINSVRAGNGLGENVPVKGRVYTVNYIEGTVWPVGCKEGFLFSYDEIEPVQNATTYELDAAVARLDRAVAELKEATDNVREVLDRHLAQNSR